jgi:hypothetical protein
LKILFDVDHCFAWAHGGVQNFVENLMKNLQNHGIEVEPLRWWDKDQKGDIIHTLYKPGRVFNLAKNKGIKIVCSLFLDSLSSRSAFDLLLRKYYMGIFKKLLRGNSAELGWNYGEIADAYIYHSQHEANLGKYLFNADLKKSYVALYGVEKKYFSSNTEKRESDYLISINTIHPRKNNIQLAKLAKITKIPIKFIGKPYAKDEYFDNFISMVDNKYVIYEGYVSDDLKNKFLMEARGMVTLSKVESGCIAVLESFASNCPVFLPDLAWAKSIYDGYASFGNIKNESKLAVQLTKFYNNPYENFKKYPVKDWDTASLDYIEIYKKILNNR